MPLLGTDALAASPSFPVAGATFSPHRTLIMSALFAFIKKSCPALVLLYFMCVMIRERSGASVLQGVPSCVVRQNDLVETQRGGM